MQSAQPLDTFEPPMEEQASPTSLFPRDLITASERLLVGLHIIVAMSALSLGIVLGPFQTFRRAPALQWEIPIFSYYYQALTLHGVLNALVFTTFFIMGISLFVTQRSLGRPIKSMQLAWASFWLMLIGLLLAALAILSGTANVLFTFYAPMLASWPYYLGLTLVIVGTWVGAANIFWTYFEWRAENPGQPAPLAVYALLANFMMWITASLGVAIEVLTMLLPMSLGIIDTTDAQLARIFFWFFGHPLVYFWLIPAYVSWYTMLPRQLGVRLFSDAMARVAFIMIAVFSIPIGVHHLYADPGVSEASKFLHAALTFVVAVPSLLTAFNVGATLERAGRQNGGEGTFGWIRKLPWMNPVVVAQLCGMLLFVIGGLTGIMNASFNMNIALHNTTWVVGHFHMTLAGAVFLTYISILYWVMPMMRNRKLWMPQLATAQVYTWFIGMIIFGSSMGRAGIEGATRRTDLGAPGAYISEAVGNLMNWSAVGGAFLLVSSILLYVVIIGTVFVSKEESDVQDLIQRKLPKGEHIPAIFERWRLWIAIIVVSNLLMWGPVVLGAIDLANGFWAVGNTAAAGM